MMYTIYSLFKYIAFICVFLIIVGVAQFGQLVKSNIDVRVNALNSWAGDDEGRKEKVAEFTKVCLEGSSIVSSDSKMTIDKNHLPRPRIESCSEENNYTELNEIVNEADLILQSTSWPLSLLDYEMEKG